MNSRLTWAWALSTMVVAGTAHAQTPTRSYPPTQSYPPTPSQPNAQTPSQPNAQTPSQPNAQTPSQPNAQTPPQPQPYPYPYPYPYAPPQPQSYRNWHPQQYPAHLSIHAAPATQLVIVPLGASADAPPVARCSEYCDFWAWPGKYTLHAQDQTGKRSDLPLRITQASHLELVPSNDGLRATGEAIGITGVVALLAGFILTTPTIVCSLDDGNRDCGNTASTVGVGLLIAGAIATPIGWTMYAENGVHLKQVYQGSGSASGAFRQVRLGVAGVGLAGFGLAGVASF